MTMATSRTNALLGYPPEARLLIVNADDFGMCQAINAATVRTLEEGIVRSTSLMLPCPGSGSALRLLRERPAVPFGVHLTVVCETIGARWGPVAPAGRVPSLLDDGGHFFSAAQVPRLLARAKLDEVEVEFRAQIEAVLAARLRPTHLDWHCLSDGGRADVFDLTLGLAREYGLALRVAERRRVEALQGRGLPTAEHGVLDSFALPPAGKAARYAQRLRALPAGLSEWAVHPGLDTAELRAMFASEAGWEVRQTDFDFLVSPEARALVQAEGIILSDYRPLQARWRSTHGA
jgi:chitin disaccharide deacetylase